MDKKDAEQMLKQLQIRTKMLAVALQGIQYLAEHMSKNEYCPTNETCFNILIKENVNIAIRDLEQMKETLIIYRKIQVPDYEK